MSTSTLALAQCVWQSNKPAPATHLFANCTVYFWQIAKLWWLFNYDMSPFWSEKNATTDIVACGQHFPP